MSQNPNLADFYSNLGMPNSGGWGITEKNYLLRFITVFIMDITKYYGYHGIFLRNITENYGP